MRSLSKAMPIPFAAASIAMWLRSNNTRRHVGAAVTPAATNQRPHCICDLTEWIRR